MENLKSTIARIKAKGLKWSLVGGFLIRSQGMCPVSCLLNEQSYSWCEVGNVPLLLRLVLINAADGYGMPDHHRSNLTELRRILFRELGLEINNNPAGLS